MDDSLSSTNYMTTSLSSRTGDDNSSQQSSWTLYFADLMMKNCNDQEDSFFCSDSSACSATRKDDNRSCYSLHRCRDKLISKRRKLKAKTFVDQDLEDTATSPVHSPKVNDFSCMYMKSKEVDDRRDVCQEKEQASQKVQGIDMGFSDTELRRKGYCLVPMSMLLNYYVN